VEEKEAVIAVTNPSTHESQPPGPEQASAEPGARSAGIRKAGGGGGGLVGTWATSDSFGDVVDAGTGAYIRSSYAGESYQFREDGTFWHLFVGSGMVASGAAVQEGDYIVRGNVVTLHSKTESWTPNPNKSRQRPAYKNKPVDEVNRFEFSFSGPNTLNFTQLPYRTQSTYYRTRKSR
jgi:hypothetical protein